MTTRPGPEPAARSKGEPARGGGRARPGPLPRKRPHPVGAPLRRGAPTGPSAASAGFRLPTRHPLRGALRKLPGRARGPSAGVAAGSHGFTAPGEPPARTAHPCARRQGRPASTRLASHQLARLNPHPVGEDGQLPPHQASHQLAQPKPRPSAGRQASPHQASRQLARLNPRPSAGRPASPRQARHQLARLNPRPSAGSGGLRSFTAPREPPARTTQPPPRRRGRLAQLHRTRRVTSSLGSTRGPPGRSPATARPSAPDPMSTAPSARRAGTSARSPPINQSRIAHALNLVTRCPRPPASPDRASPAHAARVASDRTTTAGGPVPAPAGLGGAPPRDIVAAVPRNYVERDLKRFAGVERSREWRRLSCGMPGDRRGRHMSSAQALVAQLDRARAF